MNAKTNIGHANIEPSAANGTLVTAKVQRLSHEEPTNKARQHPVPVELMVRGDFRILMDEEDLVKIEGLKLYPRPNGYGKIYITVFKDGKHILLHRIIMDAPEGVLVDHKDGNTFDFRKSNLRFATKSQNAVNTPSVRGRYGRGVSKPAHGGFNAEIRVDGKRLYLGHFATKKEAQEAYKQASLRFHGEFSIYGK